MSTLPSNVHSLAEYREKRRAEEPPRLVTHHITADMFSMVFG